MMLNDLKEYIINEVCHREHYNADNFLEVRIRKIPDYYRYTIIFKHDNSDHVESYGGGINIIEFEKSLRLKKLKKLNYDK